MAGLRPIGSEKLEGMDKISRIMEIARYKEVKPTPINEDKKSVYSKTLADGHKYIISKEKVGYVIKRSLTESSDEVEYLDRMENRKHYSSYSQAFKRLNLIAREVNINEGQDENISLFEQSNKKYTLKTPKPAPVEEPVLDVDADTEMDVDMGTEMDVDMDVDMDADMDIDDDMDLDMDVEDTEEISLDDESDDDEVVTFKSIQKLTGKLGQKIRSLLDSGEEMSSKDVKYVINSILSALDLSSLDEEDKEDVLDKFEDYESEDETEFEDEDEDEIAFNDDIELDDETEEFSEMTEDDGNYFGDAAEDDYVQIQKLKRDAHHDAEEHRKHRKYRKGESVESKMTKKVGDMLETIFSESKVDSVLEKYFVINESEKNVNNNKSVNTKKARRLSESISQEVASIKFMKENPKAECVGKTNKGNIVFESDSTKFRISSKGMIL
jgi:hypothetical protein